MHALKMLKLNWKYSLTKYILKIRTAEVSVAAHPIHILSRAFCDYKNVGYVKHK